MDSAASALDLAALAEQAAASLYQLCAKWSDAPRGVHELMDDLERAGAFFDLVDEGIQSQLRPQTVTLETEKIFKELDHVFRKAQTHIAKLQTFVDRLLQQDSIIGGHAGVNSKRRLRWLENFAQTNRLRRAMKDTMRRICALLILEHFAITEEARTALIDLAEHPKPQTHRVNAYGVRDVNTADEEESAEAPRTMSEKLQSEQAQTEKFLFVVDGANTTGHMKHADEQRDLRQRQVNDAHQSLTRFTRIAHDSGPDPGFLGGGSHSITPLTHSTCHTDCRCACHTTQSYGTWYMPWLSQTLGSLLISYHGTLFWKKNCTDFSCRASLTKAPRWLKASYTLPPWLLRITVSVFVSPGPPSPELLLRVINHLPAMSSPDAFWNLKSIVGRGDLDALKFALTNRLASPHDVHRATGQTPLVNAIREERYDMVKILLHAGADPFQGPISKAAVTMLLDRIHTNSQGIQRIATLFSVTDIMQAYDYTDLHRIILGILPLDTSTAIANNPALLSQLNKPTLAGSTPAHLAATRGNTNQLAALHAAGADLSLRTANASTPLHLACIHQHPAAALFLLNTVATPATVTQQTEIGNTPLHCIVVSPSIRPDMWRVADRLLALGADVNARALCDVTPLITAAYWGSSKAITWLLAHGADIDARDSDGDTALVEAVLIDSVGCARVLLAAGADVTTVNVYGRAPLHYLAGAGSEAMMGVFIEDGALARDGVDKSTVGTDGMSAVDMFNRRPNPSERIRATFQRLMESIPDRVVVELAGDGDECEDGVSGSDTAEEEEYFDAVQQQ